MLHITGSEVSDIIVDLVLTGATVGRQADKATSPSIEDESDDENLEREEQEHRQRMQAWLYTRTKWCIEKARYVQAYILSAISALKNLALYASEFKREIDPFNAAGT